MSTRRKSIAVAAAVALAVGPSLVWSPASASTGPYDPFFAQPAVGADLGASARPFGVAAGDYDGDGRTDLVVGRTTGNVAFVKGNGDGTFQTPVVFPWKQSFFNGWAFAPGDVNGDGNLDVVWGASATSSGCSVPGAGCVVDRTVNDGEVRVWHGNGDGTFQQNAYYVSGVLHNLGAPVGRPATSDAGSVSVADVDADGDADVVAGAADAGSTAVVLYRNDGGGSFTAQDVLRQTPSATSPTYFPATSTQNSPWGLAFGDADGDGDTDLWVGDRALYVYLYSNDGSGTFTITPGNIPGLETRPNVYLRHDSYRAAVGYTASLASSDVNGDGRGDLMVGLHSGTQTPASSVPNDGLVVLDVSKGAGHTTFGPLGDLGTMTRGLQTVDVNGDGATDVVGSVYEGQVKVLRQLPPRDSDGDGISDYVDNAPSIANAPRIEMNADGSLNAADQLDNDFDTVLGNPEDEATWSRLGDPADDDDDNDGASDSTDNCVFTPNGDQTNKDGDSLGDACDPLFDSDADGDGVPAFDPADPLYGAARAAKAKWASDDTKFVLRIDALGRFFQNEFTQLMTDAAVLDEAEWAAKCWESYDPGDVSATYEPCGDDATKTLTLPGGRSTEISLVVIPKHLWTDPPVVAWMSDRLKNSNLEVGQHGTFHDDTTMQGDWATMTDRNFFSCEGCGLTEAESFERFKVGYDTLVGNYANKWVAEMGATATSPKVDWSGAAHPLITYAAPYNTSDDIARKAVAQLGFRSFTASIHEERPTTGYGEFFASPGTTLEDNDMEDFDSYGLFHGSADTQLDPVETPDGSYDAADAASLLAEMQAQTEVGGLNTWLIEEVEWSGRTNNESPRNADPAHLNREDNTVYVPRWEQWLDLLDYVNANGVVMTLDEVALARAFDNAPTVANADQADTDADGVGDVIDGASLTATDGSLSRNVPGTLSATLANGSTSLAGQAVSFTFDADGDGADETYPATTDSAGLASVSVTATRTVGPATFGVSWTDGQNGSASDIGAVQVNDATGLVLDATNPTSGQVTDAVTVGATLTDSDGAPVEGQTVTFTIGGTSAPGTTDASGHATATMTLVGPAAASSLHANFAGAGPLGASTASAPFAVAKEDTALDLVAVPGPRNSRILQATLTEADGAGLAGQTITFQTQQKVKGQLATVEMGTAVTDAQGVARFTTPTRYVSKTERPVSGTFAGDASHLGSTGSTTVSL